MTKDIYFVRHGETMANRAGRHQHYDEPLSNVGYEQAAQAAEAIKELQPESLYTSRFARARQTAEVIGDATSLPYSIIESVHEIRRPDYLYGRRYLSVYTAWYLWQLFWYRKTARNEQHAGENMFAVRNRVHDTKGTLLADQAQRIVVVSHSFYISMFITLMCQQKPVTFRQFVSRVLFAKKFPNTSVVHVRYCENSQLPWQLMSDM